MGRGVHRFGWPDRLAPLDAHVVQRSGFRDRLRPVRVDRLPRALQWPQAAVDDPVGARLDLADAAPGRRRAVDGAVLAAYGKSLAAGTFDQALAALFYVVCLSGIAGYFLQLWLPGRL